MWVFAGYTASGIASEVWRFELEAGAVLASACELRALCGAILPPAEARNWTTVASGVGPWPAGRSRHTQVVDAAGRLWIHGGESRPDRFLNDWWSFDTQAGERSCSKI